MDTYEKKYKEANDKIVARFGTNVAKEIFTDLYESDDENVRKWLLNLVQSLPDKGLIFSSYDDIEKAKVLAWIEKQDPKKHEEELEKAYKTADEVQYKRGYEDAVKDMEKQGKQAPAWSEEEERYICQLESMVKEKWALAEKAQDEDVVKSMSNLTFFLKTLNPNKKPADEDMKELLRTEYEKGRADAIAEMQKEWSEEDEKKRKCLIKGLEDRMGFGWAGDTFSREEYINWLKSLRPQNRWRPSDKHIRFLQAMVNDPNNASSESCQIVLKDILEKLKKLKEGLV